MVRIAVTAVVKLNVTAAVATWSSAATISTILIISAFIIVDKLASAIHKFIASKVFIIPQTTSASFIVKLAVIIPSQLKTMLLTIEFITSSAFITSSGFKSITAASFKLDSKLLVTVAIMQLKPILII